MIAKASATLTHELLPGGVLRFSLGGRLDSSGAAQIWAQATKALAEARPKVLEVQAADVTYCDGAGAALLLDLSRRVAADGGKLLVVGLAPEFERLRLPFHPDDFTLVPKSVVEPTPAAETVGRATWKLLQDLYRLIGFAGELTAALVRGLLNPTTIRWRDALLTAERAGVDALPIVMLLGFLLGLIMAFQAAIPMSQFGADLFVANLVAISIIRELGPLMTAIVLAGRSGAAFAAEIGTMKVNEEVNALTTMGVDPVRFLVVTRVLAAVAVMPFLALFANLAGLIGGLVVYSSLGFPFVTYVNQITGQVSSVDLLGGLAKALVFGLLIAAVGCLRGLETRTGASAVGQATTSAVVSGIVLLVVADGIFAVVFYALGI